MKKRFISALIYCSVLAIFASGCGKDERNEQSVTPTPVSQADPTSSQGRAARHLERQNAHSSGCSREVRFDYFERSQGDLDCFSEEGCASEDHAQAGSRLFKDVEVDGITYRVFYWKWMPICESMIDENVVRKLLARGVRLKIVSGKGNGEESNGEKKSCHESGACKECRREAGESQPVERPLEEGDEENTQKDDRTTSEDRESEKKTPALSRKQTHCPIQPENVINPNLFKNVTLDNGKTYRVYYCCDGCDRKINAETVKKMLADGIAVEVVE